MADLPRLTGRWRAGELGDASFAAGYCLLWQIAWHGRRFAARLTRTVEPPDPEAWRESLLTASDAELRPRLLDWFAHYQFRRMIPAVSTAFRGWLEQHWPLRLLTYIPAPLEVLSLQAVGIRPVTVLTECPRALRPVLNKANGFEFLVHDLEHGYKFYHDPAQHLGQRRLFVLLECAMAADVFQAYLGEAGFARQFDYLISDMNTHPVHSLRFLNAVLIECQLRREGKTHREPMSPSGRAELRALMHTLADLWGFSPGGRSSLVNLVDQRFDEAVAKTLESAILETDCARPCPDWPPAAVKSPTRWVGWAG